MSILDFIFYKKSYLYIFNFLLGVSLAFGFEPFNIPFLSILVIGLYFLINDLVLKKKLQNQYNTFFCNGLFFGFGFFLLSMYWVSNSILEYDPNLFYVSIIILIIFPLSLSIFFGLMQMTNAFFWDESNSKIFYFSSIWIIFEFLRSKLFTGLPWNLIGYSWSWSLEYSQTVSILGTYGLGLLTVFCSACLFSFVSNKKNKIYFLIGIIILGSIYLFGFLRINNHEKINSKNELRIVHTYLDQKDKWTKDSIDKTAAMGSSNLITIFPETSLGFDSNRPKNWVVGYIRKDENNFFNSITYMGYTYDKKILVPFGEYFPFSRLINNFFPESSFFKNELTKGSNNQSFPINLSPFICYEIIFPSFVRKNVSNDTNLLVNISNDGWFGNFSGPKQHFVHAQFRSIELGIPMVRSSNKGISGLISPVGKIMNVTESSKTDYLDVKIPKKLGMTTYREYGNIFTYFLIVLFFIIGYATRSK